MYFNTIDRAYANRKGQNKAHDLIPWDDNFHLHADMSCEILEGIMKGKGSSKWKVERDQILTSDIKAHSSISNCNLTFLFSLINPFNLPTALDIAE